MNHSNFTRLLSTSLLLEVVRNTEIVKIFVSQEDTAGYEISSLMQSAVIDLETLQLLHASVDQDETKPV